MTPDQSVGPLSDDAAQVERAWSRDDPSALRSEAERVDAIAEEFLSWSTKAFGDGHPILGQACSDHAAGFVKRASILREEAAVLEARWPNHQPERSAA